MRKHLFIILGLFMTFPPVLDARSYDADMSSLDRENISFIITTLADTSYFRLLFKQGELEKAGEEVRHVHPLRFLGYVFADPSLRNDIGKMRTKRIVWSRFWGDMRDSLEKESQIGEVDQRIAHLFAEQVNREDVEEFVTENDWDKMIEHLLNN